MKAEEILKLARDPKNIKNVGLSAQVDHGKTTLSDVILAYAGVISPRMAGQILYLDYLEEEQRRGITIKTAAISVVMRVGSKRYVLNLIDTPGHVDFSGKVSRAMRLMDGVIILVDAVEGIMAQTEAYLRVALQEYVKPILFINKVDRLIDELSMSAQQIQNKFEEIILGFNDLIEMFGDEWQKKHWKVSVADETVLFGSALQGWGFSVPVAVKKGLKFTKILKLYKENLEILKRELPLGELMARVIYEKLPSPVEAQKYRVPKLWSDREPPDSLIACDVGGETVLYISKLIVEAGRTLAVGRVFSGKLKKGKYVCLNDGSVRSVDAVRLLLGATSKYVEEIPAGMVFGAFATAKPGETLASEKLEGCFSQPAYIAVPVVFVAVEPKRLSDFEKLLKELKRIQIEDPNISVEINKDTGQIIVAGLGELHLEIILKELSKRVDIYASKPMISYREALIEGSVAEEGNTSVALESVIEKGMKIRDLITKSPDGSGNQIILSGMPAEEREAAFAIISGALKNGPLIGEPVVGAIVKVKKKDKKVKLEVGELINALARAFSLAKTEICEPYYEFNIITVSDHIGAVVSEINRRSGKINKMESAMGNLVKIEGIIPVRKALELTNVIRSVAHGRASVQLRFYDYIIAKDKDREEILNEIRERKGLL